MFHAALNKYFEKLGPLEPSEAIEIMKICGIQNVNSDETIGRRASTVLRRIDWVLDLVERE